MQRDKSHSFPDSLDDTIDNFILDATMRGMTPPEQDIGLIKRLLRKPVLRFFQSRNVKSQLTIHPERVCNASVNLLWIDCSNLRIFTLMDIFVPDYHFERLTHDLYVAARNARQSRMTRDLAQRLA